MLDLSASFSELRERQQRAQREHLGRAEQQQCQQRQRAVPGLRYALARYYSEFSQKQSRDDYFKEALS